MRTSAPASYSDSASMVAPSVPVLTRSADARPPSSSPTASTRIDFPAPVSPVSAVNPGSSSTSTASITARLRMRSVRSMWAETPSYHTFDSIFSACYPALSALSQRRVSGSSEEQLNTLGTLLLALQLQEGAAPVPGSTSVLDLVMRTGPVNQSVLALLAVLSIVSWAIILHKSLAYRSAGRHTRAFLDAFRKSS